jgi:hypothetical protein
VLAGEKIDLEAFVSHAGPDKEKRVRNIAEDPFAASHFFHFMIKTILETLFKIKVIGHKVKSGKGILGQLSAYFAIFECQARGTLHAHMLL